MKIIDIFESIQGESSYQKKTCFFLRLAGCNLRCKFLGDNKEVISECDTKESWSIADGKEYSIEDLCSLMDLTNCEIIEVTGAEPLLQLVDLESLIKIFRSKGNYKPILIETNGTQEIYPLNAYRDVIFILDVKPFEVERGTFNERNFEYLDEKNSELKFLIGSQKHITFMKEFMCRNLERIKTKTILVSPIFSIDKKLLFPKEYQIHTLLIDLHREFPKFNFQLNLQIHKFVGVK